MIRKACILTLLLIPLLLHSQADNNLTTGFVNVQNGDYQAAREQFTLVINDNSSIKALYYRGISLYYLNQPEKALSDLEQAYSGGNSPEALLWMARCYAVQNKALETVRVLQNYFALDDVYISSKILKDSSFKTLRESEEWQNYLFTRTASEKEETANEIEYYLSKGKFEEGIDYIDRSLLTNNSAFLYYHRAIINKGMGNLPLAYADILIARQSDPNNPLFLKEHLHIAAEINENEKVIELSNKLIKVESEDPYWFFTRANAQFKNNEANLASESLEQYLRYYPNNIDALVLDAEIKYKKEEYISAIRTLNKIEKQSVVSARVFQLRGLCFLETNTVKSASYNFSMSLDLDPTNESTNLKMGIAEHRMGNHERACYFWERASFYGSSEATEYLSKFCK